MMCMAHALSSPFELRHLSRSNAMTFGAASSVKAMFIPSASPRWYASRATWYGAHVDGFVLLAWESGLRALNGGLSHLLFASSHAHFHKTKMGRCAMADARPGARLARSPFWV